MRKLLLGLCFSCAIFLACQETVIDKQIVSYDYGYFPLDTSFYKEFAVTTINIDALSEVYDTTHYYIKEIYTNWLTDASNDTVVRLERLYRESSQSDWENLGVWSAKIKGNQAIQTEENVKFIKIIFPIVLGLSWDGNAMNRQDTLKQYPYEVLSLDIPETVGELSFDSVLTIKHKFEESLVIKLDDYEKYAYNLGLVYKQNVALESQNIDPEIPIEERLTRGTSIFKQIIDYGYE